MDTKRQPRILVCTINAWNAKVGDNTFPTLLQEYPKSNIANLFIREEQPDSPVCDTYFRISESRVMRSIFHRGDKTGYVVSKDSSPAESKPAQYANKDRFYYTKLFCREAIWMVGRWKTRELDAFIEEFAPEVVIYEMSRYIHMNRIVMYILQRTKAVGIGCFWDDTFTYKQEKSLGYKALRFFQRRNLRRLVKHTQGFFAITPKTKREADAFFGIQSTVLTKPILQTADYEEAMYTTTPLKMLYTGNIGIGRLGVLKLIVRELAQINTAGIRLTLDVYTNTPTSEKDRAQLNTAFSTIHPPVPQAEALALQKNADILLFVESLGTDNKIARLSFSTKITDYYAAGKCIFAVGNSDLAPMELFSESDSAITAVSEAGLTQKLHLLTNVNILAEYARKAFTAGQIKHSYKEVSKTFIAGIEAALNKGDKVAGIATING